MKRPLHPNVFGLGLGLAIAAVVACGGAPGKSMSQTMPSADAGAAPVGKHDARIEALDKAIDEEFAKLDLGARPTAPPVMPSCETCVQPTAVAVRVKPADDPQCKPGQSTTCTDTCKFANSICDNAKKICDISKELPGDAWAAGKCSDGETSCETASKKCCGCQ